MCRRKILVLRVLRNRVAMDASRERGPIYNGTWHPSAIFSSAEAKRKLTLFNAKVMTIHNGRFKKQVFVEGHGFTVNITEEPGTTVQKRGADRKLLWH
jgi:hypothetical protein